jgi:hypothetical protein
MEDCESREGDQLDHPRFKYANTVGHSNLVLRSFLWVLGFTMLSVLACPLRALTVNAEPPMFSRQKPYTSEGK